MALTITIEIGAQANVSDPAVLTGVHVALAASLPDPSHFSLGLTRAANLRLLRLFITIPVPQPSATIDVLLANLARIPGVASVSTDTGQFFFGPAYGSRSVANASDQVNSIQAQTNALVDQQILYAKFFNFIDDPWTPAGGALTLVFKVQVTDADSKRITLYPSTSVKVLIDAGGTSASDATLTHDGVTSAVNGELVVPVVGGEATLTMDVTSTGTVKVVFEDIAVTGLVLEGDGVATFS